MFNKHPNWRVVSWDFYEQQIVGDTTVWNCGWYPQLKILRAGRCHTMLLDMFKIHLLYFCYEWFAFLLFKFRLFSLNWFCFGCWRYVHILSISIVLNLLFDIFHTQSMELINVIRRKTVKNSRGTRVLKVVKLTSGACKLVDFIAVHRKEGLETRNL